MLKVKIYSACNKIWYIIAKAAHILAVCLSLYLCAIAISSILYLTCGIKGPSVLNLSWVDFVFIMLLQVNVEKLATVIKEHLLLKADLRKTDRNN